MKIEIRAPAPHVDSEMELNLKIEIKAPTPHVDSEMKLNLKIEMERFYWAGGDGAALKWAGLGWGGTKAPGNNKLMTGLKGIWVVSSVL